MKKSKKILVVLVATLVLCVSCMFQLPKLRADSGFDSSYSGGSSSSSGSSWGGSSSSSGGSWGSGGIYISGSSDGGSVFFWILVIVVVTIIILSTQKKRPLGDDTNIALNLTDIMDDKIKQIIPGFERETFIQEAFNIYQSVQKAWMNFDLESVRDVLTDEIYNMYTSQLMTLKVKHEKNIMGDFNLIDAKITGCEVINNNATITTVMTIDFYDYIINEETKAVLRGRDDQKMMITYEMTFTKKLQDIQATNVCPNCGAPIEFNTSGVCEYCDSVIVNENAKWVLAKKKNLMQK